MLSSSKLINGGGDSPSPGSLDRASRCLRQCLTGECLAQGCMLITRQLPDSSLHGSAYQDQKSGILRSCLLHPTHTSQSTSPLNNTLNSGASPGFRMSPLLTHLARPLFTVYVAYF